MPTHRVTCPKSLTAFYDTIQTHNGLLAEKVDAEEAQARELAEEIKACRFRAGQLVDAMKAKEAEFRQLLEEELGVPAAGGSKVRSWREHHTLVFEWEDGETLPPGTPSEEEPEQEESPEG